MMPAFFGLSFVPFKLACAFFAFLVTKRFLVVKPGIIRQILFYAIHVIPVCSTVYIGDLSTLLWMGLVYLGGICLLCSGRLIARFSIGLVLFSASIALDALLSNTPPPAGWFLPQISLAFWLGSWLVIRKILPKNDTPVIESTKFWLLLDLLAILPVGSVLAVVGLTELGQANTNPDPHWDTLLIPNEQVIMVVLVLAVVSSVGLVAAIIVLARHEKLEREQALAQMRSQYYMELEKWQGQVRQLRHDMANHLTAMCGLDDAGMRGYLNDLIVSPAMAAPRRYCENDVVQSVISSKVQTLENSGIKTDFNLSIPQNIAVTAVDLSALFANILDNAIEASLKLPEKERHIKMQAHTIQGMFMLLVKNNMEGNLKMQDGDIATTKEDSTIHGFGLRGIRSIVDRYNGSMQAEQIGNIFQMTISLCI